MRSLILFACLSAWGQEANSGFDLRGTISAQASYSPEFQQSPRAGSAVTAAARAVLYPTWKLSPHWTLAGVVQVYSRPYFAEEFSASGYEAKANLLQLHLTYSRFLAHGSVAARIGQLSPAFGAFHSRYDDAVNPLLTAPWSYGYYGKGVTLRGLPSAQVEGTYRRLDARVQLANSSPANPRTLRQSDQYAVWLGGVGYTVIQGLRVGASAYRGPYLSRDYEFFFPGEAAPRRLPGEGVGLEAQWARGAWSGSGEWQRFRMAYRAIPDFRNHTGYGEVRRVLHPRWFVAGRISYVRPSAFAGFEIYEVSAGYRPNRFQILKLGYGLEHGRGGFVLTPGRIQVQLVTTFQGLSVAGN